MTEPHGSSSFVWEPVETMPKYGSFLIGVEYDVQLVMTRANFAGPGERRGDEIDGRDITRADTGSDGGSAECTRYPVPGTRGVVHAQAPLSVESSWVASRGTRKKPSRIAGAMDAIVQVMSGVTPTSGRSGVPETLPASGPRGHDPVVLIRGGELTCWALLRARWPHDLFLSVTVSAVRR